jgi:hypothetical protein
MQPERALDVVPPPWTLRGNATVIPFRRGLLAFVRYLESEVGPYDELLWLAPFQRSQLGRAHHVAPIFVSSQLSIRSGRANWGLPKQLADFRVSSLDSAAEQVDIHAQGQPLASFIRQRPRGVLPLDASQLPPRSRRLVQLAGGLCFETVPEARGHGQLTSVSRLEINRELLPGARGSRWRPGLYLCDFELRFPAASISAAQ